MAETDRDVGAGRGGSLLSALLRACWPLPGALSGAAIGFHLYFRQPGLTTDSAAALFLASGWALGGMVCGLLCSSLAGALIARGLRRRLRASPPLAAGVALLCVTGLCWSVHAPLEARLPALLWPAPVKAIAPRPPAPTSATVSPCRQPAPDERRARQAWELECR